MEKSPQSPNGVPRIISILSSLLQKITEDNDSALFKLPQSSPRAAPFRYLTKPAISVRSYFERIFKFTNCSPSVYIVAYIYLDRFLFWNPTVAIDSFNAHRFILTSVLVAAKFMDDLDYNNTHFAHVGGINLKEMNWLELNFLYGVRFKLYVTPEIYNYHYNFIIQPETCTGSPQVPPSLLCSFSEEESSSCNQQKMAVRPVF